jgi:hypothetical protein
MLNVNHLLLLLCTCSVLLCNRTGNRVMYDGVSKVGHGS